VKIGYARVSKVDDSQSLDGQIHQLKKASVRATKIYTDKVSGKETTRPGLEACLKALRKGDCLVVSRIDRLGRNLAHLIKIGDFLNEEGVNLIVLSGAGQMDTTTSAGKLMFQMFSVFASYERELIIERTKIGLTAARARGRMGGRKPAFTKKKLEIAKAAMSGNCEITTLCKQLRVARSTLYKYVTKTGGLTPYGKAFMKKQK